MLNQKTARLIRKSITGVRATGHQLGHSHGPSAQPLLFWFKKMSGQYKGRRRKEVADDTKENAGKSEDSKGIRETYIERGREVQRMIYFNVDSFLFYVALNSLRN